MRSLIRLTFLLLALALFSSACQLIPGQNPTPTPQPVVLTLRNWEGDIADEILQAFTAETGIQVTTLPYDSQEEALAEMEAGLAFDVVVLENQLIPNAVDRGLLASINFRNVPNFANLSPEFLDPAYDRGNAHSIPYSLGATGLVVRTDLADPAITHWADLWRADLPGKIVVWNLPRDLIGLTLKSLGYPLNSEDPAQLEAALQKLIELKPRMILVEWESAVAAPYLVSGEAVAAMGLADDMAVGLESTPGIAYILPVEGGILWGDNFTIPANAPHKAEAEQLINFLLKGEVAAQIIENTRFWLPNTAALALISPELRDNSAIFPTRDMLRNAEVMLPISPEAETLYQEIWEKFQAAE